LDIDSEDEHAMRFVPSRLSLTASEKAAEEEKRLAEEEMERKIKEENDKRVKAE